MFSRLLAKSPAKRSAGRLYAVATRQARSPALYAVMGVDDTVEGRFELLTLHIVLLIDRLKEASPEARDVRQHLFDVYVSNLDGALREMGVGDLAVGKRMHKLGEAFYGRARAYDEAFAAWPDRTPLDDALGRLVPCGGAVPGAPALAAYVWRCREVLAAMDTQDLVQGEAPWPNP